MLTDEQQEQYDREYKAAPEAKLLSDEVFEAYANMSGGAFMMLPEADRTAYHSTAKWHQGQRMSMADTTGITVGGKSLEEIARIKAEKDKGE